MSMKEITYSHDADGEIIGVRISEQFTKEELETKYPRSHYPEIWERLDDNLPASLP